MQCVVLQVVSACKICLVFPADTMISSISFTWKFHLVWMPLTLHARTMNAVPPWDAVVASCQVVADTGKEIWISLMSEHLSSGPFERCLLCHSVLVSRQGCYSDVVHYIGQGFKRVYNLSGGIHAYAVKADPTVPTYWEDPFSRINQVLFQFLHLTVKVAGEYHLSWRTGDSVRSGFGFMLLHWPSCRAVTSDLWWALDYGHEHLPLGHILSITLFQ